MQELPQREFEIIEQFDKGSDGLDVRELRNLLNEYRIEKRESPLNLPEVPKVNESLEEKTE